MISAKETTRRVISSKLVVRGLMFGAGADDPIQAYLIWPDLNDNITISFAITEEVQLLLSSSFLRCSPSPKLAVNVLNSPAPAWLGLPSVSPASSVEPLLHTSLGRWVERKRERGATRVPLHLPNLATLGPLLDVPGHPWNFAWLLLGLGEDFTGRSEVTGTSPATQ